MKRRLTTKALYPKKAAVLRKLSCKEIAFLDPGIQGTGIAQWDKLTRFTAEEPDASEAWNHSLGTQVERRRAYANDLEDFLRRFAVRTLVIEYPELWSGSALSHSAVVRGDLFMLATLIGVFEHVAGNNHAYVTYVKPREWKAQLPKEAIAKRVLNLLGTKYSTSHELEAVAMGLSAARVL